MSPVCIPSGNWRLADVEGESDSHKRRDSHFRGNTDKVTAYILVSSATDLVNISLGVFQFKTLRGLSLSISWTS